MFSLKITRRQFLKWLSASAATIGLSQTDLLKLEQALAAGPTPNPNMPFGTLGRVVWITGQDCGGCATTLLNFLANPADPDPVLNAVATTPLPSWLTDVDALYPLGADGDIDIGEVVLEIVSIEWAYIVMAASGDVANDYLKQVRDDGGYVLMMDGSIPTAAHGKYCKIMDVNGWLPSGIWDTAPGGPYVTRYNDPDLGNRTEITMAGGALWLAQNAVAVVSMGTCNSWGGIPAAKGAVTGAKSGWEWINGGPAHGGNSLNKLHVNIPGCAPNPDWFVSTVAAALLEIHATILAEPAFAPFQGILLNNLNTEADHKGRPKNVYSPIYNTSTYAFCPDDPRLAMGASSPLLGCQKSAANPVGRCMKLVGCNGWMVGPAHVRPDCPTRKWNPFEDHSLNNWCVGNNMPCQGCASPGFPDYCSPFYKEIKGVYRGYSYI
jgi:hydrogenase small subunit